MEFVADLLELPLHPADVGEQGVEAGDELLTLGPFDGVVAAAGLDGLGELVTDRGSRCGLLSHRMPPGTPTAA